MLKGKILKPIERILIKIYTNGKIDELFEPRKPKFSNESLEKLDTEELKTHLANLHIFYLQGMKDFYKQELILGRNYCCKNYGEMKELLDRMTLILNNRTRKPIYKVIITKDKKGRRPHYVFMGYKNISVSEITDNSGKDTELF